MLYLIQAKIRISLFARPSAETKTSASPLLRAICLLRPGFAPPYQTSHTVACPPQNHKNTYIVLGSPLYAQALLVEERSRNPDLKTKQYGKSNPLEESPPGSKKKIHPRLERRRAIRPWRDNNNGRRKAARNEMKMTYLTGRTFPRLGLPRDPL